MRVDAHGIFILTDKKKKGLTRIRVDFMRRID